MKKERWMAKAFVLGAVFFLAAFIVKPVGVSTQFSVMSGIVHGTIDPDVIIEDDTSEYGYRSSNAYYDRQEGKLARSIKHPWNYDFVFVLSIPFGAFIVSSFMKKRNQREEKIIPRFPEFKGGKRTILREYFPSFAGGFILLYGARMADGCTSGHMMSGMMQGAVSGYLFAAAVFAVAIPTAIIIGIRQSKRGGR